VASQKDLKPCPFGCVSTTRSPAFYSLDMVQCMKCNAKGPTLGTIYNSSQLRQMADEARKEGAALLWNTRGSTATSALRNTLAGDANWLQNMWNSKRKGQAAPAAPQAEWRLCQQSKGEFVCGVEYKVRHTEPVAPGEQPMVVATDSEGTEHTVPAKMFVMPGLLDA